MLTAQYMNKKQDFQIFRHKKCKIHYEKNGTDEKIHTRSKSSHGISKLANYLRKNGQTGSDCTLLDKNFVSHVSTVANDQ